MNMKRKGFLVLVWLSSIAVFPACAMPLTYNVEPLKARIIDAETRQPLAGVIVVAHWQLERGTMGGNVEAGQLAVMEAVTDEHGQFSFPGFGPKVVWNRFLVNKDPELLIFESGYYYLALSNTYSSALEMRTHPVRRSKWNGKTIELKPFKGTLEEYGRHLGSLPLSWAYSGEGCEWKKMPHMVRAAHEQATAFKRHRIISSLPMIQSLIPYEGYPDKCEAREYFKEFQQ